MKRRVAKQVSNIKTIWKRIYLLLFLFLLLMIVMTIVSRIINSHYIPIIMTKRVGSGTMKINSFGKGTVQYGTPQEFLQYPEYPKEPDFYVRGYFYDKGQEENVSEGDEIKISIHGMRNDMYGNLKYKIYNYETDKMEVIISLDEEEYLLGSEVDFIYEKNKVRYKYIISKDVLYQENDGSWYLYVLKERDNILGNGTIASKLEVHILAENDDSVAIEEVIDINTKLIVKDERLSDGIRVREKE